jgi:hypothetical protein
VGHCNHYGNAALPQVLLKRQILIDREQRLEAFGEHEFQEFAIAFRRPTHINDVMRVVAGQIAQ